MGPSFMICKFDWIFYSILKPIKHALLEQQLLPLKMQGGNAQGPKHTKLMEPKCFEDNPGTNILQWLRLYAALPDSMQVAKDDVI